MFELEEDHVDPLKQSSVGLILNLTHTNVYNDKAWLLRTEEVL